jgi:hypothetical protein
VEPTLSKLDVARRQLVTAIRLFFGHGDPVSVFTLAANSWEVIDALCARAGIEGISHHTRGHIPAGLDLKRDFINSPFRNFFKHADRDPDEIIAGFDDTKNDGLIFLAADDYMRLTGKSPIEFQVFQLWYLAVYIEKVSAGALEQILEPIESTFPNIRELARNEQLALGRKALNDAASDRDLLNDKRTEAT